MHYSSQLRSCGILAAVVLFLSASIFTEKLNAQTTKKPFSVDLSLGKGFLNNAETEARFQPEIDLSYIPGRWGLGVNAAFFSYEPSFGAKSYREGFEQFTIAQGTDSDWRSFNIGIGPRLEFGSRLPIQFKTGFDVSLAYSNPPEQNVEFSDPEGAFHDLDLPLYEMSTGDDFNKWAASIKPQFQVNYTIPGAERFGLHFTTGIQHRFSDQNTTIQERDLSNVKPLDNAREMFFQFETAPVVERTEQAPQTNFFVNAGIKISFGGSRAPAAPAQDYNSSRSNKPSSIANNGGGDCDDEDPRCTPGSSHAQDYNSSRSNKPTSEAALDDVVVVKQEGLTAVDNFIDDIIEVLDRCEDEVCTQVRQNADGRKDVYRQVNQSRISQDQGIEDIHSIVMEDVVSLQRCESDVCKEVLTKEVQLQEHMNVLMSLVQSGRAAATQDYINEWDELIDESVELAQDYNSSRSNKPSTRSDEIGDGEEDGSGQQVVLIKQDGEGKVYAWGGEPEAIMQDENGKLYAWGSSHEARLQGENGKVYSWGVASSASLQSGDGEVYCWGDNSKASLQDGGGNVYCWGNNSRASVDSCEGDSCPQPGSDALYLAKELGLASVGDDIEQIKQVLDRCDEDLCGQVRLNADHRDSAVRRAQDNPAEMDTHINEILNIVKEDVESLGSCETDVCRKALAMEEKLLVKMNRLSDLAEVAPAQDYNSSRSNKPRTEDGRGGNDDIVREANRMARLVNPTGIIVNAGGASLTAKGKKPLGLSTANGENPLYEGSSKEGENPLYEGQANDGDSGNNSNGETIPVQRFQLQPSSYCVDLSSNSQQGKRKDAQNHNSSRSNETEDVAKPDLDSDGFPEIMKGASFSISKRSARTGRNPQTGKEIQSSGGDTDGDGYGDIDGIQYNLEIDPIDPDDDGDGFADAIEMATYSISKRSARTGRNESQGNKPAQDTSVRADDTEIAMGNGGVDGNLYKWGYNMRDLQSDGNLLPGNGTLTVLYTGGKWHFNLHVDPDDDGDGLSDFLQNISFSISKRSARTGRNPQTGKEIK